ncbi:hypothetical protein S8a_00014 [Klebsiella phage VLCpiS8a]|nr:hypothetical protein S8a_00014 [Klebsiella phage VLCpiS8a]
MKIKLKIRERREALNMTQADLVKATGLRQPRVCRYDSGKEFPTIEKLVILGKALKCEWHELVDVTDA